MSEKKEKKKNVTIKLYPSDIRRLEEAAQKTGFKKNTIVEQGIRKRLSELQD
jgi:predicted DNA-binding protein